MGRSIGLHANSKKLVCDYGHIFTKANTSFRVKEDGSKTRVCRTCRAASSRAIRGGYKRDKPSAEYIAELDAIAREMAPGDLETWQPDEDTGAKPWESPESWVDLALCANRDPDLFYPEPGDQVSLAAAKATCKHCQVRDKCLEKALRRDERYGVWGGLDRSERIIEAASLRLAS